RGDQPPGVGELATGGDDEVGAEVDHGGGNHALGEAAAGEQHRGDGHGGDREGEAGEEARAVGPVAEVGGAEERAEDDRAHPARGDGLAEALQGAAPADLLAEGADGLGQQQQRQRRARHGDGTRVEVGAGAGVAGGEDRDPEERTSGGQQDGGSGRGGPEAGGAVAHGDPHGHGGDRGGEHDQREDGGRQADGVLDDGGQ